MVYPSAVYRVKAALIDLIFVLLVDTIFAYVLDSMGGAFILPRTTGFVMMVCVYEPVAVSFFGGTLGHQWLGIEVRKNSNQSERVGLLSAGLRSFFKYSLGFPSIVLCFLTKNSRAIHDFVGDSVVVLKEHQLTTEPTD